MASSTRYGTAGWGERGIGVARCSVVLGLALAAGGVCAQDCDGDGVPDAQQTFRWRANGAGFWGTTANWQSSVGGIPAGNSLALFDGTDGLGQQPYRPFFDGFVGIEGLGVLSCSAEFDLGSSVLSVTGDEADCREYLLGGSLGAEMLVFGGGQFRIDRAVIADQPGTTARLTMDGSNASLQLRHLTLSPVIVGQFGDGAIVLLDTQFVHSGTLVLGSRTDAQGTVSVSGGSELLLSAEVTSDVIVGFAGKGLIGLEQDGVMSSNGPAVFRIGDRVSGDGEIRFTGLSQPQQFQASLLEIGGQGLGRFRVVGGSIVEAQMSGAAVLGAAAGSRGEIDVLNFSELSVVGSLVEVGRGGQGQVSLGEGSLFEAPGDVSVFVDGVVQGSGDVAGDVTLIGGEIRANDAFAETGAVQRLRVDGSLVFHGTNPTTGEFETGRMVYTLVSPNPSRSLKAQVTSAAIIDGTLRVVVPGGVVPQTGEAYRVIDAGSLTGTFDGVQTDVIEGSGIAIPVYDPGGEVAIKFFDIGVPESVLEFSQTASVSGDLVDGVLRDVTKDGFPDLVVIADEGPGQEGVVRVTRNLGVSTNGQWLGFDQNVDSYGTLGDLPGSVAVGDMNGDTLPDLVMMNRGPSSGQVRIRLNSPTALGDFSQVDPRVVGVQGVPADITLVDISGNGLLDVVTVFERNNRGTGNGGIEVAENEGSGFDDSEGDTGDEPGSVDSMGGEYSAFGVANTSKAEASVFVFGASVSAGLNANRGSIFPLFFLQEVPAGREPDAMFTADLNGDGLDDIISSDRVSGTISVLIAQDFGEIIYDDAISLEAGESPFTARPGSVVAIDINEDDRLDLVFTV